MAIINERMSIVSDEAINIYFPQIRGEFVQILLIYEASKELHKIDIKEKIVEFLVSISAYRITAYVNSSIYFRMRYRNSELLDELDLAFREYIEPFEIKTKGRMFFVFNELTNYLFSKEEQARGIRRVAMVGRGNKTLKDNFEIDVAQLKLTL